MVRLATQDDLDFLEQHDPLLKRAALADKVERGEVYVVEHGGQVVGWARHNLLCDLDPFLTMLYVLEPYRRQGFGSQLMRHWEQQMGEQGHHLLLTCTQADEEAQFFYRKLGYTDSGAILFPGQVATELVLVKRLSEA
jgi:GNAT superfamily N-acetyltransferase